MRGDVRALDVHTGRGTTMAARLLEHVSNATLGL